MLVSHLKVAEVTLRIPYVALRSTHTYIHTLTPFIDNFAAAGSASGSGCEEAHPAVHRASRRGLFGRASRWRRSARPSRRQLEPRPLPAVAYRLARPARVLSPNSPFACDAPLSRCRSSNPGRLHGRAEGLCGHARCLGAQMPRASCTARCRALRDSGCRFCCA